MRSNGNPEIFRARRDRFMKALGVGAVAILPSAPAAIRSNDVEFVYRQDSDFYYLTGFPEPESAALFAPGHCDGEFVLFVAPRDRERDSASRVRMPAQFGPGRKLAPHLQGGMTPVWRRGPRTRPPGRKAIDFIGDPSGSRTRVTDVRGRCPNH